MAESTMNEDATQGHEGHNQQSNERRMDSASEVELNEPTITEDIEPSLTADQPIFSSFASNSSLSMQDGTRYEVLNRHAVKKRRLAILAPPVERPWEYRIYEEPQVVEILEENDEGGTTEYLVQLDDGLEEVLSLDNVHQFPNGTLALAGYEHQRSSGSVSETSHEELSERRGRRTRYSRTLNISSFVSSDDELVSNNFTNSVRQSRRPTRGPNASEMTKVTLRAPSRSHRDNSSRSSRTRSEGSAGYVESARTLRNTMRKLVNHYEPENRIPSESEDSDEEVVHSGKRKRRSNGRPTRGNFKNMKRGTVSSDEDQEEGVRRSGRNVARKNMREVGEEYIPEKTTASAVGTVKYTGARESFQTLADDDHFRLRHCQTCDACGEADDSSTKGHLVYCQGCTLSYHHKCLGPRNSREHLVTKVGEGDFVLQCRRCIGLSAQKDPLSPNQRICFACHEPGDSTAAFRDRKTTKEEQKDREDNGGEDPVTDVLPDLVNNHFNVLFRCLSCYRSCHMHHLPPKSESTSSEAFTDEELAARGFSEYHTSWVCQDCSKAPADVESLVAWRPLNVDHYEPGLTTDQISEDSKEYLVKWKKMSYHSVQWMPGAWVWGVTLPPMRKAFARRENSNNLPKMTTAEAVPEDYLRVDIVLDAEYTSIVKLQTEHIAKARVTEVTKALVKFKGLGYEDVVWMKPPSQQDIERWADFKFAYEDWVVGAYIREPGQKDLKANLAKVRNEDFGSSLEIKSQPDNLVGGKLMSYQLEGLNWLYYQWFKQQNAILADEMGLGKTIQVIGFLATLKETHGCWPFLVVVPNSTCPNWRREIKRWAPSLRVVTYYGLAEARKLAAKYELFAEGKKTLGCHVVVTSYDAASDPEFRQVFRGVHWAGLVVDEGQRLKNDKGLLYGALNALKPPFKLLMTGTPLQNNARELFNLLQFLDSSINAQQMEEQYVDLTKENVAELHDKLRQCFLRRTKAEVLTMLPPMAQIILPVSVSVLQKQLYKSILAKNPELLKSIMTSTKKSTGKDEKANLNNILMQLRKCLCHPFVYSKNIEVRNDNAASSHRNLVDASSKLQLLEIMLPKLQERGHRVLIFSQFLDMLDIIEDFLDGLGLFHERLDGTTGSLQKQKKIDAFNADGSQLFAFLLSTRAGGVGINLATADTVIILDPDFNPHQDIQALSRAHRIGQKKKVLVFQLLTRATVEEKILQVGKKKMALDQVLIEQMDNDEDEPKDIASILRYGAEAIFKDEDPQEIKYDSASVDRLLDRSQIENTQEGTDKSAESQFSFAKVWVNDKAALEEGLGDTSEQVSDPSVWEKILEDRRKAAAKEAAAKEEALGRGRRRRQAVDYSTQDGHVLDSPPTGRAKSRGKPSRNAESDDTDFQEESEEEEGLTAEEDAEVSVHEIEAPPTSQRSRGLLASQNSPVDFKGNQAIFQRAKVPVLPPAPQTKSATNGNDGADEGPLPCVACNNVHPQGYCPLKLAGVEFCPLCGLAHLGYARTCPHLNSVTQLRFMLDALKRSPEAKELTDLAKKKITGIIGDLNQRKRKKKDVLARHEAELRAIEEGQLAEPPMPSTSYYNTNHYPYMGVSGDRSGLNTAQYNTTVHHTSNFQNGKQDDRNPRYSLY